MGERRSKRKVMDDQALSGSQEIPGLHGLRGLASLLVFISHAANEGLLHSRLGGGAGQVGVMLFFTLSGFLLSVLYLDTEISFRTVARYTMARIARVYPLFFVTFNACFFWWLLVDRDFIYQFEPGKYWDHVFLLDGIGVFWTIPPEMQFYIVFVGIWSLWAWSYAVVDWKVWAAALLAALVAHAAFVDPDGRFDLVAKGDFFLAGTLSGVIFIRCGARFAQRLSGFEGIVLAALFIGTLPQIYSLITGRANDLWNEHYYIPLMMAIVLVFACGRDKLSPLLGSRLLVWLGLISFSLYLIHRPFVFYAGRALEEVGAPAPALFAAATVVVMLLSATSFYWLERPARRWIMQVTRSERPRPAIWPVEPKEGHSEL